MLTIDSLELERLDFLKIDVEGMEAEVLQGAQKSISATRPQMLVEVLKSDANEIRELLAGWGYSAFPLGLNILAVHNDDPVRQKISFENDVFTLAG